MVAQMLLTQGWLRCPGSSSQMGIHANLPLEREKKPKPSDLLQRESKQECHASFYEFYINNSNDLVEAANEMIAFFSARKMSILHFNAIISSFKLGSCVVVAFVYT